jgi:hypothetical protein
MAELLGPSINAEEAMGIDHDAPKVFKFVITGGPCSGALD